MYQAAVKLQCAVFRDIWHHWYRERLRFVCSWSGNVSSLRLCFKMCINTALVSRSLLRHSHHESVNAALVRLFLCFDWSCLSVVIVFILWVHLLVVEFTFTSDCLLGLVSYPCLLTHPVNRTVEFTGLECLLRTVVHWKCALIHLNCRLILWLDGWIDRQRVGLIEEELDRWIDWWMDRWMDQRTAGSMDGYRRMDGWIKKCMCK